MPSAPHFRFGIIGDPQYGDKDDGYVEDRNQRYREVPGKLKVASEQLAAEKVDFVLVMGDLIDGQPTVEATKHDLDVITSALDPLAPTPIHHVVGNHDVTPCPRSHFLSQTGTPSSYYVQQLAPGWRLMVLDTTDMCLKSGYHEGSTQLAEAQAYWDAHTASDPPPNMFNWNGGITKEQWGWLDSNLEAAEKAGDRLIVASHHPIGLGCARPTHMAWDADKLQARLTRSSAVEIVFHGHDHMGGYACTDGVHFITVEAMLEAPEGSNSFGIVQVSDDEIIINGTGTVTSRSLPLRKHAVAMA